MTDQETNRIAQLEYQVSIYKQAQEGYEATAMRLHGCMMTMRDLMAQLSEPDIMREHGRMQLQLGEQYVELMALYKAMENKHSEALRTLQKAKIGAL